MVGLLIAVPAAWSMAFSPTIVPDRKLTRMLYAVMLAAILIAAAILYLIGGAREDWRIYGPIVAVACIPIVYWIRRGARPTC